MMTWPSPEVVERACEVMHDAYEAAAVGAGWETQQASRKPWADVPEANKATMRAAVSALLDHLAIRPDVDALVAEAEQRGRVAALREAAEKADDIHGGYATSPMGDWLRARADGEESRG